MILPPAWWVDATKRQPEFQAICDALVESGLCAWDARGNPHPQSYALCALWAQRRYWEQHPPDFTIPG